MLTEQQKAAREASLGSSDAPIVSAVSPYKSPLELYYQLEGSLPRYTDDETEAQRIGSRLEPVIAELAAEKLGYKIRRSPTRRHAVHPFMVANLDFEIVGGSKGPGVMECKNRGADRPFETVPDDIAIQVCHQLAVTNREWGIVAVLFGFGVLKTYEVQRDRELEDYLIELEMRFMVRVAKKEPPDEAWTASNVDLLKRLYPRDTGKHLLLEPRFSILAQGFQAAKQEIATAEDAKAACEGELKSALGDATSAECPGYKLSWKCTKDSQKFDLDRFKEEQKDLYSHYLKTVPGHRVFRVTPAKELAS